jgi:hypothetical protein
MTKKELISDQKNVNKAKQALLRGSSFKEPLWKSSV